MKFYGNGIVWDKEKNRALCQFEKGELETEDERIISILEALNYGQAVERHSERQAIEAESFADLRKQAKGKVEGYIKMKKNELIEALKEVSK